MEVRSARDDTDNVDDASPNGHHGPLLHVREDGNWIIVLFKAKIRFAEHGGYAGELDILCPHAILTNAFQRNIFQYVRHCHILNCCVASF